MFDGSKQRRLLPTAYPSIEKRHSRTLVVGVTKRGSILTRFLGWRTTDRSYVAREDAELNFSTHTLTVLSVVALGKPNCLLRLDIL